MLAKNSNVPKSSPPLVPFIGTITYKLVSFFAPPALHFHRQRVGARASFFKIRKTEEINQLEILG